MSRTSNIKFYVELDENKVPSKIEWEADDAGFEGKKESKTLILSLWDKEEKATLGIDLWTKEMMVDDMNIHVHQILLKLADTYRRSTKNTEASEILEKASADFAEALDLKNKIQKH